MPRKDESIYKTGQAPYLKRKDGRSEDEYLLSNDGNSSYRTVQEKTYKEVKDKLLKSYECQPEYENSDNKSQTLFSEAAERWLDEKNLQLKKSSIVKYRNTLKKHILPVFAGRKLNTISNNEMNNFIKQKLYGEGNTVSQKTAMLVFYIIKSIFKYYGITLYLNAIHLKASEKPMRILSENEQKILTVYLFENINSVNLGILLSLYCGLRIGELCALKWGDINLTEKTISITKTMQRLQQENGGTVVTTTEPKSCCSDRKIPIQNNLYDLLVFMKKKSECYLLTGNSDKFIEPRTMQNIFKRILNNCSIEIINFHALRHTFATRCIEVGFDVKSLSEILGHANVNITLNRYVHPSMELKRQNMNRLSSLFNV